jgi:hypothetical protein
VQSAARCTEIPSPRDYDSTHLLHFSGMYAGHTILPSVLGSTQPQSLAGKTSLFT